jgi:hypothetical protein
LKAPLKTVLNSVAEFIRSSSENYGGIGSLGTGMPKTDCDNPSLSLSW